MNKLSIKTSPKTNQKTYGKPLQKLYSSLLKYNTQLQPSDLTDRLVKALAKQGLDYHPRTIKRQLSGKIRYVPKALELNLLGWLKKEVKRPFKKSVSLSSQKKQNAYYSKIIKDYERDKKNLDLNTEENLYISPKFFLEMARAYAILKKQTSQRQLALLLQNELAKEGVKIGLETIQTAFAGKVKKIRKSLEDVLSKLFGQLGYDNKSAIEKYIKEIDIHQHLPTDSVNIGELPKKIEAYRIRLGLRSKRQLALQIQEQLKKQGYDFHLSSLQSVLEGKTQRTKYIVLETIKNLMKNNSTKKDVTVMEVSQAEKNQHTYVNAENIPALVDKLLSQYPFVTRRQIALLMQQELKEKNFHFSLNSLQFILAGKTQRTRGIIPELLNNYLVEGHFQEVWEQRKDSLLGKKGRPSLENRLLEAYSRLQQATQQSSTQTENNEVSGQKYQFLVIREELIQKRWEKKFRKRYLRKRPNHRSLSSSWKAGADFNEENEEIYNTWNKSSESTTEAWERLVG